MKTTPKERLQNLKLLTGLTKIFKNPDSLDSYLGLAASLKDSPLTEQMVEHLMAEPQFKALVEDGWRPQQIDLQHLQALPKGSLGRCYSDQLISQGITPELLVESSPIANAREFVMQRLKETHDIIHILTGFGIDTSGEIGLHGFNLAQNRSPMAVMLIFGSELSILQKGESLEPMLKSLVRGFEMGLAAELVIARKLEDNWEKPLQEWRQELKLPFE